MDKDKFKKNLMWALIGVLSLVFFVYLYYMAQNFNKAPDNVDVDFYTLINTAETMEYPVFLDLATDNKVEKIYYHTNYEDMIIAIKQGDDSYSYYKTRYPANDTFRQDMLSIGIDVILVREKTNPYSIIVVILSSIVPMAILIGCVIWMMKHQTRLAGIDVVESKLLQKSDKRFSDVIGHDEIIEDLKLIVRMMKDPTVGQDLGVRTSKGILLSGPPGVGKTLIAEALAGEAGIPIIVVAGSDFKQLYVGAGAKRVRQVFEFAKKNLPCIVFIDELDAIGESRNSRLTGSEDTQTIAALLECMDGFKKNEGLFVIAATNEADKIDSAIRRPGRFDREIKINPPTSYKVTMQLYEYYLKNIKLGDDIDIESIAKQSVGMTGAEIATICNEAGMIALKQNHGFITHEDVCEAIDNYLFKGTRVKTTPNYKDLETVAYHEAGHAVMSYLCGRKVSRASVRANTSGVGGVVKAELPDNQYSTRKDILDDVKVDMAGRASEEIKFNDVTVGAVSDIQHATDKIKSYYTVYCFDNDAGVLDYRRFADTNINVTCQYMDSAIELSKKLYAEVLSTLGANYYIVEVVAKALLESEVLTGKQLVEIIEQTRNEEVAQDNQ